VALRDAEASAALLPLRDRVCRPRRAVQPEVACAQRECLCCEVQAAQASRAAGSAQRASRHTLQESSWTSPCARSSARARGAAMSEDGQCSRSRWEVALAP
jgi:hypothetical protein